MAAAASVVQKRRSWASVVRREVPARVDVPALLTDVLGSPIKSGFQTHGLLPARRR
jgi:hypothetical protein